MTERNNIKSLRELNQVEVPVDLAASWESLSAALDARKRRRIWLMWFSAASVIVGLGIASFFFWASKENRNTAETSIAVPEISIQKDEQTITPVPPATGNADGQTTANEASEERQPNKVKNNGPKMHHNGIEPNQTTQVKPITVSPIEWWFLSGKVANFGRMNSDFNPEKLLAVMTFASPVNDKDDHDKNYPTIGWEVFAGTSPSLVNKVTQENKDLGWKINRRFDEIAKASERTSAGYQFNAGIQMNIGKHWFIQSGFTYSEKQEWVRYNHTLKDFTIVRESEKRLEYAPLSPQQWVEVNFEGNNKYRFAEIPLMIGTKFEAGNKLEFRTRAGISYWRLLGKTGGKIDPTSLLVQDLEGLKNYRNNNIGVQLFSGFYYKLNPQWSVMAEPSGSLSLTNLTLNSPVDTRPYQYGLNIGVQYRLK